jgi:hypothetical protein
MAMKYTLLFSRRALVTVLSILAFGQSSAAQAPDRIGAAVEAHGGVRLATVASVQMRGRSVRGGGATPVAISASFVGVDAGSLRVDYGTPVERSFYNTPKGAAEAVAGQPTVFKPAQVGLFAQFDILAGLGIQHLTAPSVQRSGGEPSLVNGRASNKVRAVTGRSKMLYRRGVADDLDVDLDAETGLVAAITRRQIAEGTMDLTFLAGFRFSDYRQVQGLWMPFRIDRVLDGVVRESIQLDSVDLNAPLSSGFFEPPPNDYRRNPVGRTTLGGR